MAIGMIRRLHLNYDFGYIETNPGNQVFFRSTSVHGIAFEDLQLDQEVNFTEVEGSNMKNGIKREPLAENVTPVVPFSIKPIANPD